MMFGHVETMGDRIEHLERLRTQQDKSQGIHRVHLLDVSSRAHEIAGADRRRARISAHAGARTHLSRQFRERAEFLGNAGLEIGQVALKFGANDLGSIMIEENVVSQAGTTFRMTVDDMQRLIADLGYEPHQRDNWYRLVN